MNTLSKDDAAVWEKIENACFRLNAEAYENQVIANGRKPIKQFTPCAKAEMYHDLFFKKGMRHMGQMRNIIMLTNCSCHNNLSWGDLVGYDCDDTYKLAHYRGTIHDAKILYPRLCR